MRTWLLTLLTVALGWAPVAPAQDRRNRNDRRGGDRRTGDTPAAAAPVAPATGYAVYRMVRLRNVFDPDRRPVPVEGAARSEAAPAAPRNSFLILTGTMVTDNKRLAFFNGSQSDYNKVVGIDGRVADVTITGISSSAVDLQRGGLALVLPVGKQLTLGPTSTVGAAPVIADAPPASADAAPASSGPPSAATSGAPASPSPGGAPVGAPVDRAEMIRRMMERRQKENK